MEIKTAGFCIGEVIRHKLFDYYGVIYDIDPIFMGSDEWYETVAKTRPPKDQPWYHVLVDDRRGAATYVAEKNLQSCSEFREINHPLVDLYFEGHDNKAYSIRSPVV